MTIGERIKHIRVQEGIAQIELAKATKISKQNIYKYENNIITNIPSDKIELIAKALNTTPAYLMGWEVESDQKKFPPDDDLLELLRKDKGQGTIIGFGDGRHIKTDMTYEDFEEIEAMWRALKEKRNK